MSIIKAVKTYIQGYAGLETGAPVWVVHLDKNPISYSIIPIAGGRKVSEWITSGGEREYLFALQTVSYTLDELERIDTIEFYEAFADWLDDQTDLGSFPTLGTGQVPDKIEALGFAYLYQQGAETGIFQIQCRLSYTQT